MKKSKRKYIWLVALLALLLGAGVAWARFQSKPKYETVNVTRGDIVENVSVTGRVKPVDSVDLAFEKGGKVKEVNVQIGDRVMVGQQLARLDSTDLSAQLLQAEANVETEQAKLDELKRGTRPEEISVKQTELKKAEQDLANLYSSVGDILNNSYAKADDAVRSKADQLFVNADSDALQLVFQVSDYQTQIDATNLRRSCGVELSAWKSELLSISSTTTPADLGALMKKAESHLFVVRSFLARAFDLVDNAVGISATTVSSYKTNIGLGRDAVNLAISAVTGQEQAIAAQVVTVERIRNELALELAGSTPESIAAQNAQVQQAVANVSAINAQIAKTVLFAPIGGIVTRQDAKVGEIAGPNVPLISLMTESNLQIDANVPEIDVGRIAVGNSVSITLDAFQGETYTGKVSYIDPAETVIDGVVNFKVTILFDQPNSKFRSGLTANLDIASAKKSDALLLPEFAVIENDSGKFVRILNADGTTKDIPIKTGLRSKDGFVEITDGVSEGESVVNVGLKTSAN